MRVNTTRVYVSKWSTAREASWKSLSNVASWYLLISGHRTQRQTTGGITHTAEREEGTERLHSTNTSETGQASSPAAVRDRMSARVVPVQTETLTLEAYADKHRFQLTKP